MLSLRERSFVKVVKVCECGCGKSTLAMAIICITDIDVMDVNGDKIDLIEDHAVLSFTT